MKKHLILFSLFLIFVSCERGWIRKLISSEDEIADTIGPTVVISSHTSGQTVFEIITLTVDTEDDGGISKVEFFIDDSLVLTDTESPYQYDWNTTQYESNSEHIIKVISYDNSGNSTISASILLKVDHTSSLPNGGNISSVTYTLTEMTVEWEESTDGDFKDYKVLYSDTENGDRDTLETYTDKSTTSYTITEFDPLIENWFWVQVTDTLGLSRIGTGMTNEIDSPPNSSELYPIVYENESFYITWSQNNDDDFQSYKLYESLSEDMSNQTLVYETEDRTETTYLITIEVVKYYQITIEDYWGLQSTSNIEIGDYYVELWGESYSTLYTDSLDLGSKYLTGVIPPEIGNLINLTFLELGFNNLTGEIPPEIGNLTNLEWLRLENNQLTGSIPPEIGSLTNLERLYLNYNQLTGSIPPEIGNLTSLERLYLFTNELTGSIPPEIGNLTNLTQLYISSNQLTGEIPSEIGNLTNLSLLRLDNNQLTGSIPSEIGNLTNQSVLNLKNNQLTGEIPPEIGNLTNLYQLRLDNNQLTGIIPDEICNLNIEEMSDFSINNNQLCPPYPSCTHPYIVDQDTSDCS